MKYLQSELAFDEAVKRLPGGVNSPVRAFKAVGRSPVFMAKGQGAYVTDVDNNTYLDYVLSYGPLILGHADTKVISAIQETAARGTTFGAPTLLETKLAKLVQEKVPSMEQLRMVSSGTEATMSAIRLARAITGRDKIIKFDGCYHGHSDSFLVNAGSGVATFDIQGSPGVPKNLSTETLSVPYNNLIATEKVFQQFTDEIAAIIVEPIAGNMGLIPGEEEFIHGLRRLADEYGALLIFDEVMSGLRCHIGSAQYLYQIKPDLTTLGKVVGGGLPVAVFGGKKEYMSFVAPEGPMYQAGTLSGNPLAMAAGIATLKQLTPELYQQMNCLATRLTQGIKAAAEEFGLSIQTCVRGTMWGFFFSETPVKNFADAKKCDQAFFSSFYQLLLEEGVYLAPSIFESNFISSKHTEVDIKETVSAFKRVFRQLKQGR